LNGGGDSGAFVDWASKVGDDARSVEAGVNQARVGGGTVGAGSFTSRVGYIDATSWDNFVDTIS